MHLSKIHLLFSIFASCLALSGCGGGQPKPLPSKPGNDTPQKSSAPSVVNVFVENSGSMDGYVRGASDFEKAVYSYISDIKIDTSICSDMGLFYINSKKIKFKPDVSDFIERLEPQTFQMRGGDRSSTDFSSLIDSVINKQSHDEINILVSDCVFSPGPGRDAREYLVNQQIGIKTHFAEKLMTNPNFATIVYRLTSEFEGTYYNCFDHPQQVDSVRPFFIMIFGDKDRLKKLTEHVPANSIKGSGVTDSYNISNVSESVPYGISVSNRIGFFQLDHDDPKHSIIKSKADKKSLTTRFRVPLNVDYSGMLLDDSYLCDSSNYEVSNPAFDCAVMKPGNAGSGQYTLYLSLKQPVISKGIVRVDLLKRPCQWAEEFTDEDGSDINTEGAMSKTFGLKYMLDGIFEAYSNHGKNDKYATFTVKIQ